jgi:hypothetical protein
MNSSNDLNLKSFFLMLGSQPRGTDELAVTGAHSMETLMDKSIEEGQ